LADDEKDRENKSKAYQKLLDNIKDVSMAFLSANALLLTLILGFISPSLRANPLEQFIVEVATLCLVLSALSSATVLGNLLQPLIDTFYHRDRRWSGPLLGVLYVIQVYSFIAALLLLAFAIHIAIHS
jgi:hypothetical protein